MLLIFILITLATPALAQDLLKQMLEQKDFLGARIYIKQISPKITAPAEWAEMRELLFQYPQIGNDLILGWDRKRFTSSVLKNEPQFNLDEHLKRADEYLLSGRNKEAFALFQKIAQWLKKRAGMQKIKKNNIRFIYPYLLHGMGRALFADQRLNDALEVYAWIPPDYSKYRQVLFEKMWCAFRAGRVDLTLGAIASQRSGFFSKYLEPETYLVQIYLYKMLCREEDLKQILEEIKDYKEKITNGQYDYMEWAKSDLENRALLNLTLEAKTQTFQPISADARHREQETIKKFLKGRFQYHQKRLTSELSLVQAYSQLASSTNTESLLKPIEKLPSREALFKANLEIWPADSAEDWIDEVGSHRFIGESYCTKKN